MQLVRNGIVILVLIGVGYAVYTYVNKPEPTPPPGIDTEIPAEIAVNTGTQFDPGAPTDGPKPIPAFPDAPPNQFPLGKATEDAPRFGESTSENPKSGGSPSALAPPASLTRNESPPVGAAKGGGSTFADAWLEAQQYLSENRLIDAHAVLSAWYGNRDLSADDERRLVELLGQLAGTIIYSNSTHMLEQPYIVRDGDTLKSIADRYDVPAQLLAKINAIDPQQPPRPGDKLKVVRGPFDAVLDLQRKEISLLLRGQYAGRFPVVRTGVLPEQFGGASSTLQVKEKMNARGEYYVGLERNLGIYAEDYSENALRRPAETSVELSARDAEDVYDILTYKSKVAISP
ncbi:MAG: LysM peptidoglycan-binding domain-containing protein [Pirellulales bacterium]